ncbi:unnamed protein product, partial [Prorocentrum cordatum]
GVRTKRRRRRRRWRRRRRRMRRRIGGEGGRGGAVLLGDERQNRAAPADAEHYKSTSTGGRGGRHRGCWREWPALPRRREEERRGEESMARTTRTRTGTQRRAERGQRSTAHVAWPPPLARSGGCDPPSVAALGKKPRLQGTKDGEEEGGTETEEEETGPRKGGGRAAEERIKSPNVGRTGDFLLAAPRLRQRRTERRCNGTPQGQPAGQTT